MKDLDLLYQKFLKRQCSRQEAEQLLEYFQSEKGDAQMIRLIEASLENETYFEQSLEDDHSIERNHARIMKMITPAQPRISKYKWYAAAAILIAVLSVSLFLFRKNNIPAVLAQSSNDVLPGGNKAILTLGNGKTIRLDSSKSGIMINGSQLTYNDGSVIENADIKTTDISTVTTPPGGQYTVKLPDGTTVTLNASSSLQFPSTFYRLVNRTVELAGEGYFEVAKDKEHPFIVKSNGQQVEVLGTHFNVMAYSNEYVVKTTLLEGSVKISHDNDVKILKPGEQSQVADNGINVTSDVDIDDAVAWKKGYFMFSENLENIMNKISRWYNVEIVYQDKFDPNLSFQGKITRNRNLSEVLKMMEYTGNVHFKIEGRRIMVTK